MSITNSLLINESSDSCQAAQGQYASRTLSSRWVREFRRILPSIKWWLSRTHLDKLALTNTYIKFIESIVTESRRANRLPSKQKQHRAKCGPSEHGRWRSRT